MVGIDRTACKTSGPNHHTFVCDIRDLCDEEDSAGDGSAPAAKRGTSAPRALKALLASLAPASSSAAPAGARVHLLVNNAACQARSALALALLRVPHARWRANAARMRDVSLRAAAAACTQTDRRSD